MAEVYYLKANPLINKFLRQFPENKYSELLQYLAIIAIDYLKYMDQDSSPQILKKLKQISGYFKNILTISGVDLQETQMLHKQLHEIFKEISKINSILGSSSQKKSQPQGQFDSQIQQQFNNNNNNNDTMFVSHYEDFPPQNQLRMQQQAYSPNKSHFDDEDKIALKVTQVIPQTNSQIQQQSSYYIKHHLDDTEIKKALGYNEIEQPSQKQAKRKREQQPQQQQIEDPQHHQEQQQIELKEKVNKQKNNRIQSNEQAHRKQAPRIPQKSIKYFITSGGAIQNNEVAPQFLPDKLPSQPKQQSESPPQKEQQKLEQSSPQFRKQRTIKDKNLQKEQKPHKLPVNLQNIKSKIKPEIEFYKQQQKNNNQNNFPEVEFNEQQLEHQYLEYVNKIKDVSESQDIIKLQLNIQNNFIFLQKATSIENKLSVKIEILIRI